MTLETLTHIAVAVSWIATGWWLLLIFEGFFCKKLYDYGFEFLKIEVIGIVLSQAGLLLGGVCLLAH